jgi:di/tripeptidase
MLARFRDAGLVNVERDPVGNVLGLRKGTGTGSLLCVAAHLDTVFPEGTDVRVKRSGTKLSAPGIGDDTRSLAVMLAIMRALNETRAYKDRIKAFVSIDGSGSGSEITSTAVGSKRYRVTFKGPGGHSFSAFGLVNPAFALGNATAKLSKIAVPESPKTTFNVGVMGGGTSINAIPSSVWMDVDLRSESAIELTKLDAAFKRAMQDATEEENRSRSTEQGRVSVEMTLTGDRPSGRTAPDAAIVRVARAAVTAMGMTPTLVSGSSDSNVPIGLGIPAITIDSGGDGARSHALDEWIDVEKSNSMRGIKSALAIILTLAGR